MLKHPFFMRFIFLISFFIGANVFAQDTTNIDIDSLSIQELDMVTVVRLAEIRREVPRFAVLSKQEIRDVQANDVGEILQKVPGVNLKSYGGLGGLKTISVRSLGSQHSAISVDGFSVQNSQTGQVNLAQIQTNNLESIYIGVGQYAGFLNPVSSQIAGNNVSLQTFEMTFPMREDSLQIRANTRLGSFGQISGYGAAKVKVGNGFISAFGNYRTSNGLYPYEIQNGTQTITGKRSNNDYQDRYFGVAAGYGFKNSVHARVSYKNSSIDQGLPGAIIFYNSFADECLATSDHSMSADLRFSIGEGIYARAYANANSNGMRYFDPSYFNNAGFVDVTYFNRVLNAGIVGDGHLIKENEHNYDRSFYFGVEGGLSDLKSSDSLFSNPVRSQLSAIAGIRLNVGLIRLRGHLSTQLVNESNLTDLAGKDIFSLNPYASIETREIKKAHIRNRVWYRNSLRIPSFNELYYNNIGNNELNPEKANQFGYNLSINPWEKPNRRLTVLVAGYFNRVSDKIVAIPTQNLFTWSIQNVGIVHAYGGEVSINAAHAIGTNKDWQLSGLLNYSFQRSLNMTDAEGASYRHQIAYIPMHTGNVDVSVCYKKFGFKATNYLISKRYALNQNTVSNEVDGFAISDFSMFYQFEFTGKQSFRIQVQLKNAFNKSYSYIRSFIMPGRNYLISINYAFN